MSVLGFAALGLYAAILVTKLVLARRYINTVIPSVREGPGWAGGSAIDGQYAPPAHPSQKPAYADPPTRPGPSHTLGMTAVGGAQGPAFADPPARPGPSQEPALSGVEGLGMTVMQPILSGDPALGETLRCNLEGVKARFLWLVDEDDAEGLRITGALAGESNGRAVILRCPPVSGNDNPKTVKLQRGLAYVETEYVAVLDDDTIVTPKHLDRAVDALRSCTLYTGLPCYLGGAGFWSSLVTHFVNNNSALTYLPLLPLIGPLSINGMFYVMRSEELRAMGGFASIEEKLCDDYALAMLVKRHGGTIRQGATRQYLRTTVPSAAHYVRLMHRWFLFANMLVRDQPFGVQLLLFFALGLPPLLLWTGFATLSYALPFVLLLRHVVIRSLQDPAGGGTSPIISILSELLQPLHWLHATLQHTLRWRTRRIALRADGTFSYIGGSTS